MKRSLALLLLAACAGSPSTPTPAPDNTTPPPSAPTAPTNPNEPQAPLLAPGGLVPARLPSGLSAFLAPYEDDFTGMAEIAIGFLAGAAQGKPGLAELTAELLLAGGDGTDGRPPLRQAIATLGGSIEFEVGPGSTWFGIRVPKANWEAAMVALGQTLARPVSSRAQIERVRAAYVPAAIAAIWRDAAAGAAARYLLGDASTNDHITSLLDRDPSEVVLFRNRGYRPERAFLAVHVPAPPQQVVTAAMQAFGNWLPGPAEADPAPPAKRPQANALWAPGGKGLVTATLVFPLPDAGAPLAAELTVLQNCVTLDGIGGRLERLLQEAGLQLACKSRYVQCGETTAIAITAQMMPLQLQRFWQVAQAARASLAALPPTDSELQIAADAGVLAAQRGLQSAWRELRNRVLRSLRGQPSDQLARSIAALRPAANATGGTRPPWLAAATTAYVAQPIGLIAIGGQMPEDATWATRFELLPPGALAQLAGNAEAPMAMAQPHLQLACEVAGGKDRLASVTGFRAESTLTTDQGPELRESLEWHRDGTLHSTRKFLDTVIETNLAPGKWTEKNGTVEVVLSPSDANARLRAAERHPLALLASIARGDLRFRAIADRRVGDRRWLVFEAVTDRFERLRVHIDAESHLLRQVESWETTPGGTPVYLVEDWSDYQNTEGLRLPMRCVTSIDDGQIRRTTTFASCTPLVSLPK